MKKFSFLGFLLVIFLFSNCEKNDDPDPVDTKLKFIVTMSDGQQSVAHDENISLSSNQDLNISLFRLYFSNITLLKDGAEVEIKDVALLDPGKDGSNSFTVDLNAGNYDAIKFGLGVNAIQNDKSPGDFANDHPLSTYQSMYWSMLKYRFAKFEGKANLQGQLGSANDVALAFHPGTDALYQKTTLSKSISIKPESTTIITVNIDLNEMFAGSNPFDLTDETNTQTHSNASDIQIAQKFMENLKASISIN